MLSSYIMVSVGSRVLIIIKSPLVFKYKQNYFSQLTGHYFEMPSLYFMQKDISSSIIILSSNRKTFLEKILETNEAQVEVRFQNNV